MNPTMPKALFAERTTSGAKKKRVYPCAACASCGFFLPMKSIASCLEEKGMTVGELAAAAALDLKLVQSIASGNYIPSPSQRQRLAAAVGVPAGEISWDHAVPVQHLRGNGPQSGRST
jgi:hypothetical protein